METITSSVLQKYTIQKASKRFAHKRVLLRVDWNVPLKNAKVLDDTRLRESLKTIRFLLACGVSQIICISHLGRPKGVDLAYSLQPIQKVLQTHIRKYIAFLPTHSYADFTKLPQKDQKAKILLLENIRFSPKEKKNSKAFAKELAKFADIYVNDAFGTAHRAHTSNAAITKLLPSYIGILMEKELRMLQTIRQNPPKPFVSVIGFAKIADKLSVLKRVLENSDYVLVGGAVVFTFLQAKGIQTGKSLVEVDMIDEAKKVLAKYESKIILPLDVVCAKSLQSTTRKVYPLNRIPSSYAGFDVGPKTISLFKSYCDTAKTLFWNGPLGVFEIKPYNKATNMLTRHIAKQTTAQLLVGGGDTVSAIKGGLKSIPKHFYLSTGGGASLTALKATPLPAIRAIYTQK